MSDRPRVVDVHHHWMPADHLRSIATFMRNGDTLRRRDRTLSVLRNGVPVHNMDEALIANADAQVGDMDEAGVDAAVFSLGLWLEWLDLARAKEVNDELASIQAKSNGRIIGLAHVPPLAEGASAELTRAVTTLGLRGVNLNTHCGGKYLDAPEFRPFLRTVADLGVPIVVHASTNAPCCAALEGDGTMFSRVVDQTNLVVKLISSGLLEELPGLRFVLPHMGGAFAMLRKRIGFGGHETHLTKRGAALDRMWFDTAPSVWDPIDIAYCVGNQGPAKVVFGSDYPTFRHWMKRGVDVARQARISEEERAALFGGNAGELFPTPAPVAVG